MKTWQKFLIITLGYGLVAGFTFLASVIPTWAIVFTAANVLFIALVQVLTGYKTVS